jgi:hypothetical protein
MKMSGSEERFGWLVFSGLVVLIVWALLRTGGAQ